MIINYTVGLTRSSTILFQNWKTLSRKNRLSLLIIASAYFQEEPFLSPCKLCITFLLSLSECLSEIITAPPRVFAAPTAEDSFQDSNESELEVPVGHCVDHGVECRVEVA